MANTGSGSETAAPGKNKLKPWIVGFFVFYVAYAVLLTLYLFMGSEPSIPQQYRGTAADPATFMDDRQRMLSGEYSRLRNLLFFLRIPFEWGVLLLLLFSRWSAHLRDLALKCSRFSFLQAAAYSGLLLAVSSLALFPFRLTGYILSVHYGITVQSFPGWLRDLLVSFTVSWLMAAVVFWAVWRLIRLSGKTWWLAVWLCSIPFILFVAYIQPVVIDPLYHDFYPIQNKELEERILDLADQAGIPAASVYEVNMSQKTNALNAYVSGIGNNQRIVLWDTTLEKLSEEEIYFIMAHEIGHYVMNHLYWSVAGGIGASLFGLYTARLLLTKALRRWGKRWGIAGAGDLAALSVLLLIFSLLSFAVTPLSNAVSRAGEQAADRYAISLTHDVDAGISAFQTLTVAGLSEVNPPALVKWFRYTHPTMLERISSLERVH